MSSKKYKLKKDVSKFETVNKNKKELKSILRNSKSSELNSLDQDSSESLKTQASPKPKMARDCNSNNAEFSDLNLAAQYPDNERKREECRQTNGDGSIDLSVDHHELMNKVLKNGENSCFSVLEVGTYFK